MSFDYKPDIDTLKKEIPELAELPDNEVRRLYSEWSELSYSAGWLIMSERTNAIFREWVLKSPLERICGRLKIRHQ